MKNQRKSIFTAFIAEGVFAGILGVLLSVGIAGAVGPPSDNSGKGRPRMCEADLQNCLETAHVPKTGQTTSYATGDDGELKMGVAWPDPRFTNNGNGTVIDNLTKLIWTADADCSNGYIPWNNALSFCASLSAEGCGLSDNSQPGDWRLPNILELASLLDYSMSSSPCELGLWCYVPPYPFTTMGLYYWSSTTYSKYTTSAWIVRFTSGGMLFGEIPILTQIKVNASAKVWCVRGGQ
jgi:hypothetical protein